MEGPRHSLMLHLCVFAFVGRGLVAQLQTVSPDGSGDLLSRMPYWIWLCVKCLPSLSVSHTHTCTQTGAAVGIQPAESQIPCGLDVYNPDTHEAFSCCNECK